MKDCWSLVVIYLKSVVAKYTMKKKGFTINKEPIPCFTFDLGLPNVHSSDLVDLPPIISNEITRYCSWDVENVENSLYSI